MRKVQGKQFYLTLVQAWRDQHKVVRGDSLMIYYGDHSVFVANPEHRTLSPLEASLVELLVTLPSMHDGSELVKGLHAILNLLEDKTLPVVPGR